MPEKSMTKQVDGERVKITLTRSLIAYEKSQRKTAEALGLGKIGSSIIQPNNGPVRGMIKKLAHVLTVEAVASTPDA